MHYHETPSAEAMSVANPSTVPHARSGRGTKSAPPPLISCEGLLGASRTHAGSEYNVNYKFQLMMSEVRWQYSQQTNANTVDATSLNYRGSSHAPITQPT